MQTKIILFITTILLLGMINSAAAQNRHTVVKLSVNGMTMPTCPAILKSAVRKIKGVKSVEASLDDHSATIEFDQNVISLENIQDIIESHAGFTTDLKTSDVK